MIEFTREEHELLMQIIEAGANVQIARVSKVHGNNGQRLSKAVDDIQNVLDKLLPHLQLEKVGEE